MFKRGLFNFCALIALVLAFLGAILPLLPTTPFILLAVYCSYRGSSQFHQWIERHPWLKPQLDRWYQHRAISKKVQRILLAYLWISVGVSVMFFIQLQWLQLVLLTIAGVVSLGLMRLKVVD